MKMRGTRYCSDARGRRSTDVSRLQGHTSAMTQAVYGRVSDRPLTAAAEVFGQREQKDKNRKNGLPAIAVANKKNRSDSKVRAGSRFLWS
jgi:hypothetical protein